MSAPLLPSVSGYDNTFAARWSYWPTDGPKPNRRGQRRPIVAAVLLACGVIAWLALAMSTG